MCEIKRIGVKSAIKIGAAIYGLIGFVYWLLLLPFMLIMGAMGIAMSLFILIFIPIFFVILGAFIGGMTALAYNFASSKIGGLQIELGECKAEATKSSQTSAGTGQKTKTLKN